MVEQHGTVNFTNGGAFLVLSVPVSAFEGVDDDGDGALSADELQRHNEDVIRQVHKSVQLLDEHGASLPLQGLLLSLVPPDHAPSAPAKQVVALGRFPVTDPMSPLGLRVALQGDAPKEKLISVTARRGAQSHVMEFTPDRDYHALFASESVVR